MQCCIKLGAPCASLENDDTSKVSFVFHPLVFAELFLPSFHTKFCLMIKPSVAGSSSLLSCLEGEEPFPPLLGGWPWESPQSRNAEVPLFQSHWRYLMRNFLPSHPLQGLPSLGEGCVDVDWHLHGAVRVLCWMLHGKCFLHFPAELRYLFLHHVWWAGLQFCWDRPHCRFWDQNHVSLKEDLLQPPQFHGQPTDISNSWQSKHCW